jgi:hypothetical protein
MVACASCVKLRFNAGIRSMTGGGAAISLGLIEVAELRDQTERLPVETYLIRERRLLLAASEVAPNLSSAEIAPSLDYVRRLELADLVLSKEDAF